MSPPCPGLEEGRSCRRWLEGVACRRVERKRLLEEVACRMGEGRSCRRRCLGGLACRRGKGWGSRSWLVEVACRR